LNLGSISPLDTSDQAAHESRFQKYQLLGKRANTLLLSARLVLDCNCHALNSFLAWSNLCHGRCVQLRQRALGKAAAYDVTPGEWLTD